MPDLEARRAVKCAAAALVAAALAAATAQAQQIYKWVDAQGRTHYGEKPADGTPASPIAAPTPPSSPAQANNPEKWKDMERDLRTRRMDRERAEEAKNSEANSAQRKRNCEDARGRIKMLEEPIPVYKRDSKGERVYFTDEQREVELRDQKRKYQENCN